MEAYYNVVVNSNRVIAGPPDDYLHDLKILYTNAKKTDPGGYDFELYLFVKFLTKHSNCIVQCGSLTLAQITQYLQNAGSADCKIDYAAVQKAGKAGSKLHVSVAEFDVFNVKQGETLIGSDVTVWFRTSTSTGGTGQEQAIQWVAKQIQVKSVTGGSIQDNIKAAKKQSGGISAQGNVKADEKPLGGKHVRALYYRVRDYKTDEFERQFKLTEGVKQVKAYYIPIPPKDMPKPIGWKPLPDSFNFSGEEKTVRKEKDKYPKLGVRHT